MFNARLESFGRLVLGTEPRRRRYLSRFLLSAGVYAFTGLAQLFMVWKGHAEAERALVLVGVVSTAVVGFYVAIRSGFTRCLADPALTAVQMTFAIVALALGYAINSSARGMLLMLVALVLIYGAFTLSPRSCRLLGWFSVVVLGLTMLLSSLHAPQVYLPLVESLHFVFSAVVLPTIGALAGQLSRLRANMHAQKIELRDALERIQLLATRDELTGLPNRRHAQDLLARQASRVKMEKASLCLCLIDLDHFKRVNDTLGHAAGDEVLRLIAHHAKAVLRDTDVLARWGGEEFMLLLPDTFPAAAERVVERLRAYLSDLNTWGDRPELRVTFSGGITEHVDGESMQETIARADDLLYKAKSSGRDRVLLAA